MQSIRFKRKEVMTMRIPIAMKLITITATLLLSVTIAIALKSSKYFEVESLLRDQTVNLDYATSRGTEIDNILSSLIDKTKASAITLMSLIKDNKVSNQELELNFDRVNNFISFEIFEVDGSSFKSLGKRVKKTALVPYQLDENYITELRAKQQFPMRTVLQGNYEIMNGSFPKAPSLFTIGIPLLKDSQGKITHIALADFLLSTLQKPFSERSVRTFYLIDRRGVLLAHSDENKSIAKTSYADKEIVRLSLTSKVPSGQKPFTDLETGIHYYGAFSKNEKFSITMFSQISEDIILGPAVEVKRKAFFIAGMILSGSIFLIFNHIGHRSHRCPHR